MRALAGERSQEALAGTCAPASGSATDGGGTSLPVFPASKLRLGPNGVAFLDLLRALAANLVLAAHVRAIFAVKAGPECLGTIGVTVFFILSGFLILQSSLSRLQRPRPHFAPYMIDRVARIFTAYVPVLILVAAVNALLPLGHWGQSGTSTGPAAFLGNLLLLQDYPVFQLMRRTLGGTFTIRSYNSAEPFWTIPIEFWIYVVFGLTFFGLVNQERLRLAVSACLWLVALPVVVWNAAAGGGNGLSFVWLIGAMAGYVWAGGWNGGGRGLRIGAVVIAFAGICLLGRGVKIGWNFQDLSMSFCLALLVVGGLSAVEGIRHLPAALRSFCTFAASYSYSLYLVHNTVIIVVRTCLPGRSAILTIPLALLAAHGAAFLVYYAFERHYRTVGRWLRAQP